MRIKAEVDQRMGEGVVQRWVSERCTLKMQTVLICAMRGCDGVSKNDPSKGVVRGIRDMVLRNAEPKAAIFLNGSKLGSSVRAVTEDMDHYPVHWVCHVMHALEIIGYKHPSRQCLKHYREFVEALHLLPETESHLNIRLADAEYTKSRKQEYRGVAGSLWEPYEPEPSVKTRAQTDYFG